MGRHPPQTRYAQSNGAKIAYQVSGAGPLDLVMVPGLVSRLDIQWQQTAYRRFVRALEQRTRVIQSVAWRGRYARGAPEEGGEPVAGAGRSRHADWRRKQGVAPGAGDQRRGYRQQVDGQGARDRLATPARPGYVPSVDGDLKGCRSGHDAGRQRAAGDLDDLALAAGAGPGIQQLTGAIAERPGGVSHQDPVLRGGVQANAPGFDTLTERGQ
jgi:hypothetical protein